MLSFYQIYFEPFVRAGYAVAATDYQGMGAPGPYSYLVGDVEGRNVLDIARAARQVDGVPISARVTIVGHSQGGHGGFFARQIAADYAPDLTITGSAFAAPAAYFPVNPADVPTWAATMRQNTPTTDRIATPLLIAQGEADVVVPFASTEAFVEQARAAGNDITFLSYPGAGHMSVLHQAMPGIVTWIAGRFANSP